MPIAPVGRYTVRVKYLIPLIILLVACGDDARQTPDPDNVAPSAVLDVPLTASVDRPVILDGSQSTDEDGEIVEYAFSTGIDGETLITTDTAVEITYSVAGEYTVRLSVTDDDGARDAVAARLSILP